MEHAAAAAAASRKGERIVNFLQLSWVDFFQSEVIGAIHATKAIVARQHELA
jgi:hypothetical protein